MKANVGNADRIIRVLIGLAMIAAGLWYNSWLGLIAVIPLGTAAISWCPLYRLLGLSSCRRA